MDPAACSAGSDNPSRQSSKGPGTRDGSKDGSPGAPHHMISRGSDDSFGSYSSSATRSASGSPAVGRKKLSMAEFHKVQDTSKSETLQTGGFKPRLAAALRSDWFVNMVAVVILIDTVCTLIDTDARAVGDDPPAFVYVIGEACLGLYTLELLAGFWLEGISNLKKKAIMFDLFTVICGYIHTIFQLFEGVIPSELSFLKDLRLLRVIRVLRVARILQKSRSLRELQKLVAMMATCLKALGWSFIFCFAFMTLWAMLMVEFVHPLIRQMHEQGQAFQDCPECLHATSSVMRANLLIFKTVIAGDSWGKLAVPIIEYNPATAIIFCGSLMTVVFGVLNMIVAVVVDSFAESRQRDVLKLAEELEHEDLSDKRYLEGIFNRLDLERTGDLTLEELVKGAQTDPEFQSRLRVMDIDGADLEQLFEMIDADGSGSIQKEEFIRPLSRWIHESKTAPRFVKYNVDRALHQQEEILKQSHQQFRILQARLDELSEQLTPPELRLDSDGNRSWASSPTGPSMFPWVEDLPRKEPGIEQPKESIGSPSFSTPMREGRRTSATSRIRDYSKALVRVEGSQAAAVSAPGAMQGDPQTRDLRQI